MIMRARYDLRAWARDYRRYRWRCQIVVLDKEKAGGYPALWLSLHFEFVRASYISNA